MQMSVEDKREKVLERIYDDMLDMDSLALEEAERLSDIADTLERARDNDLCRIQEADVKDLEVIERTQQDKSRRREAIADICATAITNIVWTFFMAYEMYATRKFEEENVETSSVSKWLKNSFPKFRAL